MCFSKIKYRKLSLENNDLKELPETMVHFNNLEELNLSGNLFESNASASNLWYTLASIKKLKILDLSRNILRGICQIIKMKIVYRIFCRYSY